MSPDRYGERDPDVCPYGCTKGWLSSRDADVMRACPKHRPPQPGTGLGHLAPKSEDEDREGSQ